MVLTSVQNAGKGQGHNGKIQVKFCEDYKAFAKSLSESKTRSMSG